MMRLISVVLVIGVALICVFAEEELYSSRYDGVDVVNILNNEKRRLEYYDCFMDTGPCVTPDQIFFKGIFGDIMMTKCKRCTERQKEIISIVSDWYTKNKPDDWQKVVKKSLEDAKKKNADH